MFEGRDLAKLFRSVAFASASDVEGVVARAQGATAAELAKVLPVLLELGPRSTPAVARNRCQAFVTLAEAAAGPELFGPCLKALKQSDGVLRQALVALLPRVNDVGAHGELCELLASPDPGVRAAAAEVLRQVGGRTALELLTKRSLDPSFAGRLDAMNAMVVKAGTLALPLLGAVLSAGKSLEKIHALRHLASKERFAKDLQGAVGVAAEALDDRDDLVVAQTITTLGQLDVDGVFERVEPTLATRGVEVLRAFATNAAQHPSDAVVAFFRRRMREGPKAIRLLLLEVIEQHGSEPLFGSLVDALSNRDVAVRTRAVHAITALAKRDQVDAARAIVWLLRSSDVNVRRVAAEIAAQVGDKDGVLAPRLLRFLRDEDWWVRERVLDALVEMNGAGLTKHIVSEYLADESDVVRRFAVSALMRIADRRALGALVRTAQSDPDWLVAELAIEAVGRLGDDRAVAYLLDLVRKRPETRVACIAALRTLKAKEAVPEIADLVQDDDPDVRAAAIQLLDELDDGTHALWVKGCEDDPSPTVREAAGRLLRRFKLLRSVEEGALGDVRSIDVLLSHMAAQKADDLFLHAERPASMKRMGRVEPLGSVPLSGAAIRELLQPHLTIEQRAALDAGKDLDFSYKLSSRGLRFRVNVFTQFTGPAAVFRTVRDDVLALDQLGIPEVVASFARLPHGLVLVGGPTGAGKSTTLAALIDDINRTESRHVVTIEDPIEVVHSRVKSLVNQREIGTHTRSFSSALRATLRQDPDVILVGELRDLETIAFAVSAAETGHLVLGTVHTTSADATIDRLINAFPSRQQPQVRSMLAESLRAVTCQYLLRNPKGGRSLAVEVMINNDAVQALIRKGKTFQIPSVIATSREHGMQLMDTELIRLAREGRVDVDDAHAKAVDKRAFEAALGLAPSEAVSSPGAAVGVSSPGTPVAIGSIPPQSSPRPSVTGQARPSSSTPPAASPGVSQTGIRNPFSRRS